MKSRVVRIAIAILLFAKALLPAQDIPTRTLPEIGTGPALLIGVALYEKAGVSSAFGDLPCIGADVFAMTSTARKLGWTDITVLTDDPVAIKSPPR
jgi:hypothetical protein